MKQIKINQLRVILCFRRRIARRMATQRLGNYYAMRCSLIKEMKEDPAIEKMVIKLWIRLISRCWPIWRCPNSWMKPSKTSMEFFKRRSMAATAKIWCRWAPILKVWVKKSKNWTLSAVCKATTRFKRRQFYRRKANCLRIRMLP